MSANRKMSLVKSMMSGDIIGTKSRLNNGNIKLQKLKKLLKSSEFQDKTLRYDQATQTNQGRNTVQVNKIGQQNNDGSGIEAGLETIITCHRLQNCYSFLTN